MYILLYILKSQIHTQILADLSEKSNQKVWEVNQLAWCAKFTQNFS